MAVPLPLEPPKSTDGTELKLRVTDLDADHVHFILEGVELGLANALRRTMLADIPTLAIDLVEINENNSPLPDEFLAHRLGMIPLRCPDIDKIIPNYTHDCTCDSFCDLCSVRLELNVKCTTASTTKSIYASDFVVQAAKTHGAPPRPEGWGAPITDLADETDRGIMVAKIRRGMVINLGCYAVKGTAARHAKWGPAIVGFEYDPWSRFDGLPFARDAEERREWLPTPDYGDPLANPPRVGDTAEQIAAKQANLGNRKYEREPRPDDPVDWESRPSRFYFDVETTRSVPPKDIVQKGLDSLIIKLAQIQRGIATLAHGNAPVSFMDGPAPTPYGQTGGVSNYMQGGGATQYATSPRRAGGFTPSY